jgi:hypothetical protein
MRIERRKAVQSTVMPLGGRAIAAAARLFGKRLCAATE